MGQKKSLLNNDFSAFPHPRTKPNFSFKIYEFEGQNTNLISTLNPRWDYNL